jgi:hypothetical protein
MVQDSGVSWCVVQPYPRHTLLLTLRQSQPDATALDAQPLPVLRFQVPDCEVSCTPGAIWAKPMKLNGLKLTISALLLQRGSSCGAADMSLLYLRSCASKFQCPVW